MTDKVKNLWRESLVNEKFLREMEEADNDWVTPSIFWDDMQKILYASMYWGWKVANKLN